MWLFDYLEYLNYEDGKFSFYDFGFRCGGNVSGWNVAVQLNKRARNTSINGTNNVVKGSFVLGISEYQSRKPLFSTIVNISINTTNVTVVSIPSLTWAVTRGDFVYFSVSTDGNIGVVGVSHTKHVLKKIKNHSTTLLIHSMYSPMITPTFGESLL